MPNRSKFVLGMPLYGIDWADGGGPSNPGTPLQYKEIMALASEFGITPEWEATAQSPHFAYTDGEGAHHEVWYVDQQSLGARATLASSLGLGVGLWRLGSEDQSIWELPQLGGEG
jgi:spore germination protein